MSGHSHWAGIKHKKAAEDAKKGKIFGKLGKLISVAVREKGGDPNMNPRLRLAIEMAQEANMPKENVERAIKKGVGGMEGEKLEELMLEAYGPGGIALLITAISDNKNRTLSEIKTFLTRHGGKLASEGSVKWMFLQRGALRIHTEGKTKEDIELKAIDAGAEDIEWNDSELVVYTKLEDVENVKQKLLSKGLEIKFSSIEWTAQSPVEIGEPQKEKMNKLFEELNEYDDVQEIYSNIK